MASYLPILIYLVAVIGFAAVSLLLPHLVAPRKPTRVKDMPYESGMDPVGDARKPFDVKFYLMAILFLVFDIELIFLYPWAVSLLAPDGVPAVFRPAVLGFSWSSSLRWDWLMWLLTAKEYSIGDGNKQNARR